MYRYLSRLLSVIVLVIIIIVVALIIANRPGGVFPEFMPHPYLWEVFFDTHNDGRPIMCPDRCKQFDVGRQGCTVPNEAVTWPNPCAIHGMQYGNLPHPYDCDQFFMCLVGSYVRLHCPESSCYDAASNNCVPKTEGTCTAPCDTAVATCLDDDDDDDDDVSDDDDTSDYHSDTSSTFTTSTIMPRTVSDISDRTHTTLRASKR